MSTPNYHNWNNIQPGQDTSVDAGAVASKTFMTQVFGWMSGALIITAITSYLFGMVPSLTAMLFNEYGMTVLGWIVMFAPFAFVLLLIAGINKLPFPLLIASWVAYSAVTGMSLSFIFLIYDLGSIGSVFLIAAGMFGTMAVMGWITKADLSGFGRIMMMGLIGIVIAGLVNLFMQSEAMSYIISFVGVLVFTGLTAYDVQKLKQIGSGMSDSNTAARQSILGALTLYLDFINLFLFLLRLLGSRK